MEKQLENKTEIYKILDEIIEVNESILSLIYYGYHDRTIENLNKYKSTLQDFANEAVVGRAKEIILN